MSLGKQHNHDKIVFDQDPYPEYFMSDEEYLDYQRQELEALARRREKQVPNGIQAEKLPIFHLVSK